jgi:hypothetical protein
MAFELGRCVNGSIFGRAGASCCVHRDGPAKLPLGQAGQIGQWIWLDAYSTSRPGMFHMEQWPTLPFWSLRIVPHGTRLILRAEQRSFGAIKGKISTSGNFLRRAEPSCFESFQGFRRQGVIRRRRIAGKAAFHSLSQFSTAAKPTFKTALPYSL